MSAAALGSARTGLLILALTVFAVVTTETLPVGLLPAVSADLRVSEATVGLLVTLYATLVAVLAVPLTLATARVPRKALMLASTACFVGSNVLAALAPTLAVLAVGRAIGGISHAVFFSVCIGYGARLVPRAAMGRALALVAAGASAAFVLGVPLGTAFGVAVGWRGSFAALAVLTAVCLVLIALRLPRRDAETPPEAAVRGRLRTLVAAVAANGLAYTGQFILYTYVTVLLLRSGAAPAAVGPILLVFGALGLLGLWIAGPRLDRHFRRTALVMLVGVAAMMLAAGAAVPVLGVVLVVGGLWCTAFGPATTVFQTAAVRTEAIGADLAGAWINATSNVGIGAGAAVGGLVLEGAGIRAVAWTAAAAVALAAVLVLLARDAFPARTERPSTES